MLHVTSATPAALSANPMRTEAEQARRADVDFTEVMRTEAAKPLGDEAPHNNLVLLTQRLADTEATPDDLRAAIDGFTTPPETGGRAAFLALMDSLRGAAHPLSVQLDTLQTARAALSRAMGSYTGDMAVEARAVQAELATQIETLRQQIQDEAVQQVEGLTGRRD